MKIQDGKRWIVWKSEKVAGRLTKVPYSVTGKKASSTDETTWTTYKAAKAAYKAPGSKFAGIGVIFTPAKTLLGIDIDHVLDDKGELLLEHAKEIEALILAADTYTEISPSGTGLHLYIALDAPLSLIANRHAPYEAYTAGRFFTYTERSYHTEPLAIRTTAPDEARALLELIGYPWGKISVAKVLENYSSHTLLTAQPTPDGVALFNPRHEDVVPLMDDAEVLRRMFASKNGAKIQKLYDGDTTAQDKDNSRADAALLNHLAFWTRKDTAQMQRLWLQSPLGAREKTQKRLDYRERSIAGAIENCKETYTAPAALDLLYTLDSKKDKIYTQNTENMCRILKKHEDFADTLRYDAFTDRIEISIHGRWRAFEESDTITIQTKISILFSAFRKVGKDMVYDAIVKVAKENAMDSAIDFVRSIKWDGTKRLDTWLTQTYGAEDNVYHRAVGSNWMKGLVKRIVEPGCKFDYVLVLEGAQGSKKSTSLFILGSINERMNWHVETTMSTDSKDFFEQFTGKVIIEFSEGETLSRTEVKKMKAIITTQVDRFRPSYGRLSVDHPRRCVFAMTTNQDQYLKDETGNRRWLPVVVKLREANIEWLAANRDQLLAEAYHRVAVDRETLYEFPEEETRREQDLRRISDPNEERIADWYYNTLKEQERVDGITCEQVNQGALRQGFFGAMKKFEEMAIADVLGRVLSLKKKRKMVNGIQCMRWFDSKYIELPEIEKLFKEESSIQK